MEMILNEYDMVVGAKFDNGTIQDYVDDAQTYGLIRVEDTTANWFLYNKEDSPKEIQDLYNDVKQKDHFIKDEFGEEVVVFNKNGEKTYDDLISMIDAYLDDEMGSFI